MSRLRALFRKLAIITLLVLMAAVIGLRPWEQLPPAWNPWEPLKLDHDMTLVTGWKLARLNNEPEQCLAVLAADEREELDFLALEDYTPVAGCPLTNVVRVQATGVRFNAPFTVTCPLAVVWTMFERQQLQPLAEELLGTQVIMVDHFGSFACRNIYHRENARLSQHATASAFDVAGFRLADGRTVSVLTHWDSADHPDKAAFLRRLHEGACGYFGTVLGPDYNQPHENHFHFDTSSFGICR
ncbi:extensin family protein [uncultured Marinobacter sp.]|mgnify:CR=1 FL=1|uniref:extensin-like domain-containing protein n=1 Tax=uncultured Marinobacter sp. TaxID=187379 RepID=UPI0030D8950B